VKPPKDGDHSKKLMSESQQTENRTGKRRAQRRKERQHHIEATKMLRMLLSRDFLCWLGGLTYTEGTDMKSRRQIRPDNSKWQMKADDDETVAPEAEVNKSMVAAETKQQQQEQSRASSPSPGGIAEYMTVVPTQESKVPTTPDVTIEQMTAAPTQGSTAPTTPGAMIESTTAAPMRDADAPETTGATIPVPTFTTGMLHMGNDSTCMPQRADVDDTSQCSGMISAEETKNGDANCPLDQVNMPVCLAQLGDEVSACGTATDQLADTDLAAGRKLTTMLDDMSTHPIYHHDGAAVRQLDRASRSGSEPEKGSSDVHGRCNTCKAICSKLLKCSKCKKAAYCCLAGQKEDWSLPQKNLPERSLAYGDGCVAITAIAGKAFGC
jgi:hypothetical protein